MLLKYLKEVVFENKDGGSTNSNNKNQPSESDSGDITTDKRNELLDMVQREIEKKQQRDKENR
jgi:hypothetical protein